MENTKVVVMGPADVAAMRKAHKDAEKAYFEAKVGALAFTVGEMASTHEEYTLADLRAMSGLSSMEIVAQFDNHRYCRASNEAGINTYRIQTGRREVERKFVEVLPNGTINPDSVVVKVQNIATYRIPDMKQTRR
jgi:hypothetical protein